MEIQPDQVAINYLKGLVIDGVDSAGSGHPGGAMSSMDFAYLLFSEQLKWDPKDPHYFARDRFVLSAGHESMMLYALLHAADVLPVDQLKKFRQLGSQTPGHPEYGLTPHVECTTGPLGQGAAMSVGMALAAAHLRSTLDKELFSYNTWCLLGDGCMQEEVTYGAASLAGHLGLSQLIWFYDKNDAQISGTRDRAASEDPHQVFAGLGWATYQVDDGHDHAALRGAMQFAIEQDRPTLIVASTIMAKGSHSLEGSYKTHGAPFSSEEKEATKARLGIPAGESFYFPPEVRQHFQRNFSTLSRMAQSKRDRLADLQSSAEFGGKYAAYFGRVPELACDSWLNQPMATRQAFGEILKQWSGIAQLMGGSADLEPSNMTGGFGGRVGDFTRDDPMGRNIAFGVREFTMACVSNGIALHGGFVPFNATFLVFSDYMRPALRLAAMQKLTVIFEFSHDSFYVGEDGPTHQPVEHLMSLRLIPGMYVMRPADGEETEALMRQALQHHGPSCLVVSRQKVPPLGGMVDLPPGYGVAASRGGWVVKGDGRPDYVIYATGSEVALALEVAECMHQAGIPNVKVVSLPCFELFWQQDKTYQAEVLSPECPRKISIEAGRTLGWQIFTGQDGLNLGVEDFGHSAPADQVAKLLGFQPDQIVDKILGHFRR